MKWLLWREFRLNLLIVFVGAGLMLIPYLFGMVALFWNPYLVPQHVPPVSVVLAGGAVYAIVLNQLTMGLLGGNAIAGERADRSAEFMAYFPVSRAQRLMSKLAFVLIVTLFLWGVNCLVLWLAMPKPDPERFNDLPGILGFAAVTGLTFYCVAWLVSSLQPVPSFAVAAGLVTPLLVLASIQLLTLRMRVMDHAFVWATSYAVTCFVLACICLPIGAWCYLRRVEP